MKVCIVLFLFTLASSPMPWKLVLYCVAQAAEFKIMKTNSLSASSWKDFQACRWEIEKVLGYVADVLIEMFGEKRNFQMSNHIPSMKICCLATYYFKQLLF